MKREEDVEEVVEGKEGVEVFVEEAEEVFYFFFSVGKVLLFEVAYESLLRYGALPVRVEQPEKVAQVYFFVVTNA